MHQLYQIAFGLSASFLRDQNTSHMNHCKYPQGVDMGN